MCRLFEARTKKQELRPACPAQKVIRLGVLVQLLGDLPKQGIAIMIAKPVVHLLEFPKVDQDSAGPQSGLSRRQVPDSVQQGAPVRKACQGIVKAEAFEFLLRLVGKRARQGDGYGKGRDDHQSTDEPGKGDGKERLGPLPLQVHQEIVDRGLPQGKRGIYQRRLHVHHRPGHDVPALFGGDRRRQHF